MSGPADGEDASRRLDDVLARIGGDRGPLAVAVSGGVDSLTLMSAAHRRLPSVLAVHAVSPAVPAEATRRVERQAAREGWALRVIEAGEFADPRYLANPVNRCFFCKTNLYGALAGLFARQGLDYRMVSGANTDDLGEYRPGLEAAREHGVRHPYVEAGLGKAEVRALARALGLDAIAALPASPCLSSRVETGLPISADTLHFVHAVERLLGERLPGARTVRCRIRAAGTVVELDAASLAALDGAGRASLGRAVVALAPPHLQAHLPAGVTFAPYRTGSAFLTATHRPAPTVPAAAR